MRGEREEREEEKKGKEGKREETFWEVLICQPIAILCYIIEIDSDKRQLNLLKNNEAHPPVVSFPLFFPLSPLPPLLSLFPN